MYQSITRLGAVALVAGVVLAACASESAPKTCFNLSAPGTVIYAPGIDLLIRDANGRGQALGATVVVHRGADSVVAVARDTLHVLGGYTDAGTFTVRVSKPFYRDTVLPNVVVLAGDCSVIVSHVPVTLRLVPGAPPIRSLAILGADFLYAPGVQLHLSTRLDADPGIATTVAWRVSDAALASIDPGGTLTAKCSLAGGSETVTALATADTTVQATALVGVAKQTTCP